MHAMQFVSPDSLKPNPRNARTHSKKQIRQIADSIAAYGFTVPVLIDEQAMIIAGHGRLQAAKLLGLAKVPAITLDGLSEVKKRALLLADNKIADNAGWDRERLAIELPELTELLVEEALDISITGFEPVEIDQLVSDFEQNTSDPAETVESNWLSGTVVSKPGDLWQLGKHRLLCGDARDTGALERLMARERAAMAFLDPPYNVRVKDIVGRGRTKHGEFAMASGEMSRADFVVSFPKIISGRIDDVVQLGSKCWQCRQIVRRLDAKAHLSLMPSGCALYCNTPHRRKALAEGASHHR